MSESVWPAEFPQTGDKVKDIVTSFEGTVVGITKYLWGCEQVLVSREDKDGKPESIWLDVGRVTIEERGAVKVQEFETAKPKGADLPAPIR